MDLSARTLDGGSVLLEPGAVDRLRSRLRGEVVTPGSPGYDAARAIWNAAIDRHPAVIVRCHTRGDVVEAIRFARDRRLLTAVRGGGHNIAGNALCEGGLVLDLSAMNRVRVDPVRKRAQVDPGCTLADMDRATQAHALAVPVGINSTTGIAGLTLGGGFGWLSRKHGMTVDDLVSAEVVTADGEVVHASRAEHPDLFWGLRGGGGNFGVVTSFEYRLHAVGPELLCGLIVHPLRDARDLLGYYRDFAATLPDETAVWAVLRRAPPLPFLPEEWHGREVLVLAAFHAGRMEDGERVLEPLRKHGHPIADVVSPHAYAAWQQAFDPLLTPGARNYWKSHDFLELSDGLLDAVVAQAQRLPTPQCEMFIGQMGGAMGRVAPSETAYPHRQTAFILNVHGRWEERADDEACTAWARGVFRETARYATGGVYVNFMPADEPERVRAAYGPNYDRLAALKHRYDPENFFRMNQNIRPAGPAAAGSGPAAVPVPG